MSSRIWDAPCDLCGFSQQDCTCEVYGGKENESPLSGLERYSNALRQEYTSDGDRSMSYELWLCDRLKRKQILHEFQTRLINDSSHELGVANTQILSIEGENRSLIDQINTLEHEKVELEMKLGATESNLWNAENKRKQAFDLLTSIGNGQIPQADIWQKINDLVNLPF